MADFDLIAELKNTKRQQVCTRTGEEVPCTDEEAWNDFVASGYDLSTLKYYTNVKETYTETTNATN